jgi:hypothetical protein
MHTVGTCQHGIRQGHSRIAGRQSASAMSILLRALAIEASTPTKSNSMERFDSLCTSTCNFCSKSRFELLKTDRVHRLAHLFERGKVPGIILVGIMVVSWVVCAGYVCDALCVHADQMSRVINRHDSRKEVAVRGYELLTENFVRALRCLLLVIHSIAASPTLRGLPRYTRTLLTPSAA